MSNKNLLLLILAWFTFLGCGAPQPRATPLPKAPPTPQVTSNGVSNLYSGPGTEYDIVGDMLAGESLQVIGRSSDASWWQVSAHDGPAWVLVRDVHAENVSKDIPVIEVPPPQPSPTPTPTPAPTETETPLPEPTATLTPTILPPAPQPACECSRDAYNCDDAQAETCFRYCRDAGAGDVHGLDKDGDGLVCESN